MPNRKPSRSSARLSTYRAKRDFSKTPEPAGNAAPARRNRAAKPKVRYFCVQKHLASSLHYDFRLEHDGVLLSWAVPKGPSLNPQDKRLAMRTEDHPFDYGKFEGVIPEGYGAGIVMLWDKGKWHPAPGFEDVDRALKDGELKFTLNGVKLKGGWVLVRTRDERTWLLIKHRDSWSGDIDITKVAPDSVKSFGDFAQIIAAEKLDLWNSDKSASNSLGGAIARMLPQLLRQAARMRSDRARQSSRKRSSKKARARS